MKTLALLLALFPAVLYAQTDALNGSCIQPGQHAAVSGLNATNFQQGIIPRCIVTVYLTGTITKATIYSDASNTPLGNPFRADAQGTNFPGRWSFWAASATGYDVVLSGGDTGFSYATPFTLTDLKVGGGGGGSGPTIQTNGVSNSAQNVLNFTNPSSFNGLSFAFSNPSSGNETFGLSGTLDNSGLTHPSMTINSVLCTLGSSCSISGGGGSPASPVGTPQINKNGTDFGSDTNTWIAEAGVNGFACDDVTDDKAALDSLLAVVYAAGGGEIKVNGTCLISSGQINIPNSGASTNPTQPTIRITSGSGGSANGAWLTPPSTSGTLDLRFSATTGKIQTLGQGKLEIDHLTLKDGAADCTPFIYTTNTTISIHDNLFSGTASGTSACNDAIILGGTSVSFGSISTSAPFQGYNSYIEHNFFDKIRRGVYFREAANAEVVRDNTWSLTCGATSSEAAIEIGFSGVAQSQSNIFSGNIFEVTNYPYTYKIWDSHNLVFGDTFWDATATTLKLFHFMGGTANIASIAIDATIPSTKVSDANALATGNSVQDQIWQSGTALAGINGRECSDTSGSSTAQVCNTLTSYTPARGSWIIYRTTTDNTGNLTINVNGSGAASVAKWQGTTTLNAHDVRSGADIPMFFDGVNWEASTIGNGPTAGVATLVAGTVTVSTAKACTPSASCAYKLTNCNLNSSTAIGVPGVGTVSVGTSFVINSYTAIAGVAADTSIICWQIN